LKRTRALVWLIVMVMLLPLAGVATAQEQAQPKGWVAAQILFEKNCSKCHGNANSLVRAPARETLMKLSPEAIYAALTSGPMSVQAKDLTDDQKRLIAQHLGGRPFGVAGAGDAKSMSNRCATNPPLGDPSAGAVWNGWSNDAINTRFQSAQAAGLTADQVPRLKLKWAFGFPYATEMYSQPTVVSGRIFVGGDTGYVYSLDAATGCVYWSYQAQAGVRTAPTIGAVKTQGAAKYAVYFGDQRANEYAVDAATGELLWKQRVEDHPLARIVGAPKLYNGRLYVPVSSGEEGISASAGYPCCTFRGSVVALDAETGKQIWKTYSIPETPKPTKKNSAGTQLSGPAGAAIWNSPTIDVKRNALYVGTGDAYTEPAAKTSDAILALDLDTGKMLWSFQDIRNDSWMVGCDGKHIVGNCPEELGPDYDFSVSPMLRTLSNGRQFLVVSGKSGYVLALDPDKKGAVLWKTPLFEKPPSYSGLIVFGGASDEQSAYFALNQVGGVAAVDMVTGERKWFTPLAPADNPGEAPRPGQSAAVTAIPGVVFSGGWDGRLRAVATGNGSVLWEFNTVRDYTTVNGVPGKGGSMGAPGPTVVGGMLYVGSGYVGVSNGLPGNVLLAFSAE
jgi:polyvinyl alcohol dehydrogenase (cytochrome)